MINDLASFPRPLAPDGSSLKTDSGARNCHTIELCSIINIKSGGCVNDCRFCAQSSYYKTGVPVSPLLGVEEILERISFLDDPHIAHIGLVAAGARMDSRNLADICDAISHLPDYLKNKICLSFGTLDAKSLELAKAAGIRRYHHNLETSRAYYPRVCTTQSWERRADTVRAAHAAGLEVCSGFLFGLGENWADRADLARSLKELGVRNIPMNFLTPIPGSPLYGSRGLSAREIIRCALLFRRILPNASLRICAGRVPENELGKLFDAGVDAMMTGDFLTTRGTALERDLALLRKHGLEALIAP